MAVRGQGRAEGGLRGRRGRAPSERRQSSAWTGLLDCSGPASGRRIAPPGRQVRAAGHLGLWAAKLSMTTTAPPVAQRRTSPPTCSAKARKRPCPSRGDAHARAMPRRARARRDGQPSSGPTGPCRAKRRPRPRGAWRASSGVDPLGAALPSVEETSGRGRSRRVGAT